MSTLIGAWKRHWAPWLGLGVALGDFQGLAQSWELVALVVQLVWEEKSNGGN